MPLSFPDRVKAFERGFRAVVECDRSYGLPGCPDGGEYIEISCGGPKEEGGRSRLIATSEREAITSFCAALDAYAKGKNGTLFWRHRPEITSGELFQKITWDDGSVEYIPDTYWRGYARLCISDTRYSTDAVRVEGQEFV